MTHMTTGHVRVPEGHPAWIGWRDAITPSTRASRRRWVAFYPVVLVAAAVQAGWGERLGLTDGGFGPSLIPVVLLFVVFGMLRRSTRRLTAVDHPDLDERDQLARAEAFRLAYPLLLAVLVASTVALVFLLPGAQRRVPGSPGEITSGELVDANVWLGIGVWAFLWAVFLPTATLAWREPDAVAHEWEELFGRGGPSELVRDVVLLAGFAAALTLELVDTDGGVGLLVLVPVLCLVAAWVRQGAGQEPISRTIGGLGILLVALGSSVPLIAIFDGVGQTSVTAWAVSLGAMASGVTIVGLERRQNHRHA